MPMIMIDWFCECNCERLSLQSRQSLLTVVKRTGLIQVKVNIALS